MRGDRLREAREARQLTQIELASMVGVSDQQIYRYETSKSVPTADVLMRIAKTLEVSIDYLVGLVDDPAEHFHEDGLSPMERRLIWAVRNGLIYEAIETATAISKAGNQPNIPSDKPAVNS